MKKVIVGIGEILWDMLPAGKALGGAPANFAYHALRLGEEGWAVSAIGDYPLGAEIMDIVTRKKLRHIIAVTDKPTGTVQVELDDKGVPGYNIKEDPRLRAPLPARHAAGGVAGVRHQPPSALLFPGGDR